MDNSPIINTIQTVLDSNPISPQEAVERALQLEPSANPEELLQQFILHWEAYRLKSMLQWLRSTTTNTTRHTWSDDYWEQLAKLHLACQDQLDAEIFRDLANAEAALASIGDNAKFWTK